MQAKLPPGPRYPAALQTLGWWTRPTAFMENARKRYGKRWTLRLIGSPPFVFLSDPDDAKAVFTGSPELLHPGEGARVLEPVMGHNSVLLLDEGEHLAQRKLMLPAFHGERMERLTDVMTEIAEQQVDAWPTDEPIELHPRLQALTLEVILRAVFGADPGARLDGLRTRLAEILDFAGSPKANIPFLQTALGGVTPWARFVRLRAETDELIFDLIDERRAEGSGSNRDDVLAMLLEARHEDGSPMSDQELRDELMTLLVAGHETTASELAWAFERLGDEPEVLERLVSEIDSGDDEYLKATITETLRRRPVLPNAQPRLVKQEIEVGGWRYPAGCSLVVCTYLIQHDPEIYPDPYAFRPERWLDQTPGTYTWTPFGGGRRRCLGASFAQLEMKLVLEAVLSRTRIAAARRQGEGRFRRRLITLSPRDGARTVLRERAAVLA